MEVQNEFIFKSRRIACLSCHYQENLFDNDKYIEANAQAIDAIKHTLSKEQFSLISYCDSAFAV